MATDPFHFVSTAENNIRNGHTTLMEPLVVARLTKCQICEMAITVQVDLLNLHRLLGKRFIAAILLNCCQTNYSATQQE